MCVVNHVWPYSDLAIKTNFTEKGKANIFRENTPESKKVWASLVAQWLGVCLLMQGTRVRALVWEDPTCRGAAGPVSHNY